MITEYSNIGNSELTLDVLLDMARKLFSQDKLDKLNSLDQKEDKLKALHRLVFGRGFDIANDDICYDEVVIDLKNRMADIAAKRYIEEGIKKEILIKMQEKEKQYLDEMKLQIITRHTGVENASTLNKFAQLEKKRNVRLSKTVIDILRPSRECDIVGQEDAVKALIMKLASPFPQHIILYGPPGVGKTSAARLALEIAKSKKYSPFNKDSKFIEVDGTTLRWDPRESVNPLLGSVHDPIYQGAKKELADMGVPEPKTGLVTEAHGGILFIDEIGELDIMLQNKLLKVLEDKKVHFDSSYFDIDNNNVPKYIKTLFEKGAPADFILIGATTRLPEEINPALRSRCAEVYFNPLDKKHIAAILDNAADKLNLKLGREASELISKYTCEGRKAVNILADCYSSSLYDDREDYMDSISMEVIREVLARGRYKPVNKTLCSIAKETGKCMGMGVYGFSGSIIEFEAVAFQRQDEGGKVRFNETAGSMAKDSVFNALSVVRSLTGKNLEAYDIHVNCIGGGKIDGPSAGAAIVCAIYSAVMDKSIRLDTCITGEISIRGKVKPVGGVREKIRGAAQAGFLYAIVPVDNYDEVSDIDGIKVIPAGNIQEVIQFMFE